MNERQKLIFEGVERDPDAFEKIMQRRAARKRYVIYFTPRSGSSWLTDILRQTNRMGHANELFNPNFMPGIARALQADNITDYIRASRRRLNTRGVFGFEITFHQLKAVFPGENGFVGRFGDVPSFWLIRENIVEQAVSLAKMVSTNVAHSSTSTDEQRKTSDAQFSYDPAVIKRWLKHILNAELGNEDFFERHGISPLRMSYERMMPLGPERVVRLMATHVGVEDLPEMSFEARHQKLATARNSDYAERFRRDEASFLAEVEAQRAPFLARLPNLEAQTAL